MFQVGLKRIVVFLSGGLGQRVENIIGHHADDHVDGTVLRQKADLFIVKFDTLYDSIFAGGDLRNVVDF